MLLISEIILILAYKFHNIYKQQANQFNHSIFININCQTVMTNQSHQHSTLPSCQTPNSYSKADELQRLPIANLKAPFTRWVKSMTLDERFFTLKIPSYPIPKIMRKVFMKPEFSSSDRQFLTSLAQQGCNDKFNIGRGKKGAAGLKKTFLESIVLISDGSEYQLDYICFDFHILEKAELIFDFLVMPQTNPSDRPMLQACKNRKRVEQFAEKIKQCCSLDGVAIETMKWIRQQILIKFRDRNDWGQTVQSLNERLQLKQIKQQRIQNIWQLLVKSQRIQAKLNKNDEVEYNRNNQTSVIIKQRRTRLNFKNFQSSVQKYKKYDQNYKDEQLKQNNLKSSGDQKEKCEKKMKKESQLPYMQAIKKEVNYFKQYNTCKKESKKRKYRSKEKFQLEKKPLQVKCNEIIAYEHSRKTIQKAQQASQLQEFADLISYQSNICHDRRMIAYQRIQYVLNCFGIQIQLFGSCACGIAIKSSDIDIVVKSQTVAFSQLQIYRDLQYLGYLLQNYLVVSDMKVISSASIPLLKLKVDTSVPFLDERYGLLYQRLNYYHQSGIVQVDISIENSSYQSKSKHIGISSTEMVKGWVAQIPSLRSIVLVMKQFLHLKDFNSTYKQGLNTYSLVILILAYIYHAKMEKQTNLARILEGMLSFYAFDFDQKETGINVAQKYNVYYNKYERIRQYGCQNGTRKADLQIIEPLSQTKVTTKNCYLFPKIKDFFKQMLQFCFYKDFPSIYAKIVNQNAKQPMNSEKLTHGQKEKRNVFQMFRCQITS